MKTNQNDIKILIAKYWDGKTSVVEEQEIKRFYLEHPTLPEELEKERPWFAEVNRIASAKLDAAFDQRILAEINNSNQQQKRTRRWWWKWSVSSAAVAASFLIIAGVHFQHQQQAEQEAQEALALAKEVLFFTSKKINTANTIAAKQLNKIDKLTEQVLNTK